jgi:O-antigen ligase
MLPFWGAQQAIMFAFCYFAACLVTRPDKWTIVLLLLSSYNLISLNKQGVFVSFVVFFACGMLWILRGEGMSGKASRFLFVVGSSFVLLLLCGLWLQTTASGGVAKDFILMRHFHVQEVASVGSLFSMEAVTRASANRLDDVWPEAWRRICENPIVGSGFSQTVAGRPHAHNAVLDMLLGMGLLGFIPFFWGNILCMHRGICSYLGCGSELKQVALLCCILYALSYIAANMGDVQRLWVSSSILYGFCLGVLYGGAPGPGRAV